MKGEQESGISELGTLPLMSHASRVEVMCAQGPPT